MKKRQNDLPISEFFRYKTQRDTVADRLRQDGHTVVEFTRKNTVNPLTGLRWKTVHGFSWTPPLL